ncbi:MAG: vitamin K epoxide reductase family protein [Chloroflexota bacterium]
MTLLVLAIAGVAIAGYLTAAHYTPLPLVCSTTGVIDCAQVTTSAYSVVPGTTVPITVPGLAWFFVSGVLAIDALRRRPPATRLCLTHLLWATTGLLVALYLVFVEIVRLHRICLWCSAVHLFLLAGFLVAFGRWQALPEATAAPVEER